MVGWIIASLVILAFFLPWARLEPASLIGHVSSLVEKIAEDEEDGFLQDWVLMREREWDLLFRSPGQGLSGFQLVMTVVEEDISNQLARAWINMLLGSEDAKFTMGSIALAPILAVVISLGLVFNQVPRLFYTITALGCLIYYLILRWKLNESFGERIILHVELSYGIWITLYGMICLTLICILKLIIKD